MATTTFKPATEPQIKFWEKLLESRTHPFTEETLAPVREAIERGELPAATMRLMIDSLQGMPWKNARTFVAPGFYRYTQDGESGVCEVRENPHNKRRMAFTLHLPEDGGQKLDRRYAKGVIATLTDDDRLSIEEAAAWGKQTGYCICCYALLTDPKSVALGIGPVCRKKYA
ncbi:DUF6011 domain-containing protein [Nonomuraea sp. NPDC050663]|uniref:DUF6011 domain-containing protein n=1 Tax=Nonomuraea sp. NPDC050663 TaxID=3364370 RepID=UPI0037A88299